MKIKLITFFSCFVCSLSFANNEIKQEDLSSLYQNAIKDASFIEKKERLKLVPIYTEEVIGVTWMKNKYAKRYKVDKNIILNWGNVWITINNEIKNKCTKFYKENPNKDLNLRVAQLLGMPHSETIDNKDMSFVTFKTASKNVFRPCAMSDIRTTKCYKPSKNFVDDRKDHGLFFSNQVIESYHKNGYPWTRLGYTYDWNPNTNDYGASEYVIKKDSEVTVLSVESTKFFCTPKQQ